MSLAPGDIQYPYSPPIENTGDVEAPPWPEYVPPIDMESVPEPPPIDPPPEGDGAPPE